jgi:baculoviral IAP repeat-containing protein 7/8
VRLQSFENWPSPYIRPADLAAAGFYYTKQIDRVRCFECSTEICRWEDGDDPMVEHQRWGGRCRFIRKLPCGNVPIGADASMIPLPRPRSRDVCGPYRLDYRLGAEADTHASSSGSKHGRQSLHEAQDAQQLPSAARLGCLGIGIAKRPDFPDYASYEARLQTFTEWPTSMAQTKEQLADAGFFYTGTGDQTTCYHCGGGLKNWEPQDDPWVQHAKWFSTCFYVRLVKGQEFINNVTGKHVPPLSEEVIIRNSCDCISTSGKRKT